MKEKTGLLFSGGKDSCLALHLYKRKVDMLLSMIPKNKDSFMFHCPLTQLLERQADMLNLPLLVEKSEGKEEEELIDLKKLIKKSGVNVLVIGGIKSNYQARRIRKIAEELNVKVEAPLWNFDADKLWNEIFKAGMKVIITKIASEGIPKEFVGKIIELEDLEKLSSLSKKYKFRLDFEGGDAETAVLFMPEFKNQLVLDYDVKSEGEYRHFLVLRRIRRKNDKNIK